MTGFQWAPLSSRLWRLVAKAWAGFVGVQLLVIVLVSVIDARRKRRLPQGELSKVELAPLPVGGSEVQLYANGTDLYPAMLEAVRRARWRVLFETYIWHDDEIGQMLKSELQSAAARGVSVHIIFDGLANLPTSRSFKRFPPAVHVLEYPLLSWPWHPFHVRSYARDHRKILVVDGETAFVGGYNIGADYAYHWRDTHARITGTSAGEIENVFVSFWNGHKRKRLPAIPDGGVRTWERRISVHRNDPPMLMFPIRSTYLEAIDRAAKHIYLTHAYFIPDGVILAGLLAASARGVDVRILLPETSNHAVADWLARGYYTECLEAGIHLIRYRDMVHAKTATIDGIWSTVGTANMDRLSMIGNFEVNVELYDEQLAGQMECIFTDDATHAHELTLDEWQHRPLLEKLAEVILMPLRPLL